MENDDGKEKAPEISIIEHGVEPFTKIKFWLESPEVPEYWYLNL